MNPQEILLQLDHERRHLARDTEVLELLPHLTRLRGSDRSYHVVTWSCLCDHDADEAIAGEIEHHRRLGVGFEWKLYAHDKPPDLLRRLDSRGFQIGPREAVLVYDLSAPDEWTRQPTDAKVVRVESIDQIEVYRRIAEAVFKKEYALTASQLADAIARGSTQHRGYIAYCGEHPVSIGRLYTHPQSAFGGLYGGATLPAFRGRGFYRALVAARARDAVALGARYLMVDALPTSRPVLERLGFRWLSDTWPCEWRPRTRDD